MLRNEKGNCTACEPGENLLQIEINLKSVMKFIIERRILLTQNANPTSLSAIIIFFFN